MSRIQWRLREFPKKVVNCIRFRYHYSLQCLRSLTYNHHMSQSYASDVCLEPIFWFVDNFTHLLGPFFVFAVVCLTAAVVIICYWIGLPYWWNKSPNMTYFLLIVGNWLLVNVAYNFYKATVTSPGYPPEKELIVEAVSICKKCIAPKPPRTHHCSVCNRNLKMVTRRGIFYVWISLMIRLGKSETYEPHETSHVALIGWTQPGGEINFDCAGSYLGRNVIMTGARCLERDGALTDIVRLGQAMGSPMDFHVHNTTIHYRYQAEYYYHNMAIIFLKEDPQTESDRFKPACIYSRPPPIPEGAVHLIGRGSDGSYQKTQLDLVDSDKCHEYYSPTKKLKYGALLVCCMCARNTSISKCATELGSPMQVILEKNGKRVPFLVGQKTIGRSCGTKVPGIYTRLSSDGHLPWIATIARMDFYNHDACIDKY